VRTLRSVLTQIWERYAPVETHSSELLDMEARNAGSGIIPGSEVIAASKRRAPPN
jgi:hypothetical protein